MRKKKNVVRVCQYCGRTIKGEAYIHNPPEYLIRLGLDSVKMYHPRCYEKIAPDDSVLF